MIEKISQQETLNFKDLSAEEKERRGILGVLYGPIADIVRPTRNGRKYPEKLWSKVFDRGLPKELLANGGIPGELDHPEGRAETYPDRIAIMMPEKPKKDDSGKLIARFDIISTPCGQIAHSLAKYGFKLGISSRGDGSVTENFDGTEDVNPDDYDLAAFDLVLVPACEDARLNLMTESLDTNKQELKKSLKEALEKATPAEKQIMTETLSKLNINISESVSPKNAIWVKRVDDDKWYIWGGTDLDIIPEDFLDNINNPTYPNPHYNIKNQYSDAEVRPNGDAAVDDGAALVENLQNALLYNTQLQNQIRELQEKVSVSYAKELKLEETVSKYKTATVQLGEGSRQCKALKQQVIGLTEQLQEKTKQLTKQHELYKKLVESKRVTSKEQSALTESITQKDKRIKELEEQVSSLTTSITEWKSTSQTVKNTLEENLQESRKNAAIKQKEFVDKLSKSNALVEKYKRIASTAVDRYIESKAVVIGVMPEEIKSRLAENYSFSDIDNTCEKLMTLSVNATNLPFDITSKNISMRAKPSLKESIKPVDRNIDDEVNDQLLRIAGIE